MIDVMAKIEIVGLDNRHIYMRYHRAKDEADQERFVVYHRDDDAYWLDELVPVDEDPHPVREFGHKAAKVLGPE